MALRTLSREIDRVSALVAASEAHEDDIAGLGILIIQAQRHYSTNEPCPDVVKALEYDFINPTIRGARVALAGALAALPRCGEEEVEPELLTVKQAAKRFNIGERTVYRIIENGLPVSRVGRAVRIRPSDLAKRPQDQGTKLC